MGRLREISDWGLPDELASERPVSVIGLVSRLEHRHAPLVEKLGALASDHDGGVAVFMIDVVENPSIVQRMSVRRLPAVILYTRGVEHTRWQDKVDMDQVEATIAALKSQEGTE